MKCTCSRGHQNCRCFWLQPGTGTPSVETWASVIDWTPYRRGKLTNDDRKSKPRRIRMIRDVWHLSRDSELVSMIHSCWYDQRSIAFEASHPPLLKKSFGKSKVAQDRHSERRADASVCDLTAWTHTEQTDL